MDDSRQRINCEIINDRAKLIKHRLIAREIARRPEVVVQVLRGLGERGPREPHCVEEWRHILRQGPEYVRRRICERSEDMFRLRISSPLGFTLDFKDVPLRRRIYRKAKLISPINSYNRLMLRGVF